MSITFKMSVHKKRSSSRCQTACLQFKPHTTSFLNTFNIPVYYVTVNDATIPYISFI